MFKPNLPPPPSFRWSYRSYTLTSMRITNFPLYMKTKQNVVIEESVNTHISADIQSGSVSADTRMQLTDHSKKN